MIEANEDERRGERGMVVASHPLAVSAGLAMLGQGGTAADAAVAAAAVLCVVDPRSTGIGGDLFAQYWPSGGDPIGLDAAGPAPQAMTIDALREAGYETMPMEGPWTVTVPGAVGGWAALMDRFGKLGLDAVLEPAIRHARAGFVIERFVADEWPTAVAKLERQGGSYFLPGGRAPSHGDTFAVPELGDVLGDIATGGSDAFYRGRYADGIARAMQAAGGPLNASDLAGWSGPSWVTPISASYGAVDVFELPPPGQGIVALEALGIYAEVHAHGADAEHAAIEAMKIAFADADAYVTDPAFEEVPVEALLDAAYLSRRAREIDPQHAAEARPGLSSDTVYLCVVDANGAACSLIQSLYEGFGSGMVVEGIALQNRGAGFILDDEHPNRPVPGKRPYHTIIPAMIGDEGGFRGCLGVVGGFMQPQAQMQIVRNVIDEGLDPQSAVAAPRWRVIEGRRVSFEPSFDREVVDSLAAKGHEVGELGRFEAGGAQMIWRMDDGALSGGTDQRKDGLVGSL
ncbi:MAG: gamma-glutamyltransferase family protein [Actinomycetota bacterium]|nr:gamma-glutamyltransferase family protein [Actinomycetota bacterium]